MIENFVAVTNIEYAGLVHAPIRKMQDAGKETPEAREIRVQKVLEEERKKVLPIYNSKGKVVEYDKYGRHLDIKA